MDQAKKRRLSCERGARWRMRQSQNSLMNSLNVNNQNIEDENTVIIEVERNNAYLDNIRRLARIRKQNSRLMHQNNVNAENIENVVVLNIETAEAQNDEIIEVHRNNEN